VRSYSYDHANRLTQVVSGTLTTQYAYNGDGVRTSKTVGGDTTQYVLDLAATLPAVISDTEAVYLYGLDIIAQQQTEMLYYMHDGLGSVRQLLDATGEVQASYAYDPFGVPLAGGGVHNPYQYTGEAWDAEVELLYLRARYYQPEVGRFITKDPWAGNVWRPGTLNSYLCVVNNPVNHVDPSGLQVPSRVQADPWQDAPPTSTPSSSTAEASWPQPSAVPTVPEGPPSTPSASEITGQLINRLAADYGIHVLGQMHMQSFGFMSSWRYHQLALVGEAAGDFADKVQGKELGLRQRIAPVWVFRSPEGSSPHGQGGWTMIGVLLTGVDAHWQDHPAMKWIIVHELAHWWDMRSGFRLSAEMLAKGMWSLQPASCVTPSGRREPRVRDWFEARREPLNIMEDWADSVAAYVYWRYAETIPRDWDGPRLISRSRWEHVARQMNPDQPQDYPWGARESEFGP